VIALPPVVLCVNEIFAEVVPISLEVNALGAGGAVDGIVSDSAVELGPVPIALTACSTIEYVEPPFKAEIVTGLVVSAGLNALKDVPPLVEYL
jgi:hypothetical protein